MVKEVKWIGAVGFVGLIDWSNWGIPLKRLAFLWFFCLFVAFSLFPYSCCCWYLSFCVLLLFNRFWLDSLGFSRLSDVVSVVFFLVSLHFSELTYRSSPLMEPRKCSSRIGLLSNQKSRRWYHLTKKNWLVRFCRSPYPLQQVPDPCARRAFVRNEHDQYIFIAWLWLEGFWMQWKANINWTAIMGGLNCLCLDVICCASDCKIFDTGWHCYQAIFAVKSWSSEPGFIPSHMSKIMLCYLQGLALFSMDLYFVAFASPNRLANMPSALIGKMNL